MKITRNRLAQALCLICALGFCIRESRIFWGVPLFDVFDLSRYGVPFSESTYSFQNGFGSALFLALAVWLMYKNRGSPEVKKPRSESDRASKEREGLKDPSRREKISDPKAFEGVEQKWRVVTPKKKRRT